MLALTIPFPRLPHWLVFVAVALMVSGCGKPAQAPEPLRSVKLVTVSASPYGTSLEYAAEVRPQVESRIGFRVGGKVLRRYVEVGQQVRAGQLLAELDPQDLRLAVDAARAQVAAASTQRDLAAADLRRYAQLREQNFISGAELERRESTVRAAQAQLEQAQAQHAAQGNQAGYTRLVAPAGGVVIAVEAEAGQVVASGAPVVRLAYDGPRDAVFSVPEDKVRYVRKGAEVAVRQWSDDVRLNGRVREVSASADPVTRTFQVKVALAGQAPPLGSTVYVTPSGMGLAGTPVLKLPTSALRHDNGTTSVWVFDEPTGKLRSQPIDIATADGNEVVVSKGLQPGMQVVSAGVHVLQEGQAVVRYRDKSTLAAGSVQ
jgi:membrane fusion protein, multidrug efflux system